MTEAERQVSLFLHISGDAMNPIKISPNSRYLKNSPYVAFSSISFRPMLYSRLSYSWAHRVRFEILWLSF